MQYIHFEDSTSDECDVEQRIIKMLTVKGDVSEADLANECRTRVRIIRQAVNRLMRKGVVESYLDTERLQARHRVRVRLASARSNWPERKRVDLRLPAEMVDALDKCAAGVGLTRTAVIEQLIQPYINNAESLTWVRHNAYSRSISSSMTPDSSGRSGTPDSSSSSSGSSSSGGSSDTEGTTSPVDD
jgi:predicted DNA-binding protein